MPDKLTRYSTIVGFAIRELRESLSVSQADLARAVEMAQASWSKVEKGDTVANIQHLSRVGGKLGVPASAILLRADEVRIRLNAQGWKVIDRKLNDCEADLLLDGLTFNLKIMELKAFDSKRQPATVGGIRSSLYSKFSDLIGTVSTVVGTIATGGTTLAAPAIGAAASAVGLGAAAGTLSGAAASSAGLAALGGGSLAAGGLGLSGGTAVIGLKVLGVSPDSLNEESREWLKNLKSDNSNKSSAKSTKGQIFDMAISGSEQMIKIQS